MTKLSIASNKPLNFIIKVLYLKVNFCEKFCNLCQPFFLEENNYNILESEKNIKLGYKNYENQRVSLFEDLFVLKKSIPLKVPKCW